MKKYALPLFVIMFAFSLSAIASSNSNSNNSAKSQPESTSKVLVAKKYTFTLFSFFNQTEKQKTDTSLVRPSSGSDIRSIRKD